MKPTIIYLTQKRFSKNSNYILVSRQYELGLFDDECELFFSWPTLYCTQIMSCSVLFLPATWRPPCCCCVTCKKPLHHKDLCAIFSRLRITKNSEIKQYCGLYTCWLHYQFNKFEGKKCFNNLQAILFKENFLIPLFFQIVTYCVLTRQSIKKVTSGLASKLTVCCCCCF